MSLNPEQATLKEQGNAALASGDAARAMELFTNALDMGGGSEAGRAILFSNRSAACMLIKDYQSALDDADACIRLDADFAKGWSRKAAALHGLGKAKEAAEFYQVAATKSKTPEAADDYKKLAAKCEAELSSNRGGASTATPTASTSSSGNFSQRLIDLSPIVVAIRVISFFMAFFYFFTADVQYYAMSMLLMGVSSVIAVLEAKGRPRMTTEYAGQFLEYPIKPVFLLPIVYSSMSPTPPAIFNTQLIGIGMLARNLHRYLMRASPAIGRQLGERVRTSPLLARVTGIPGWQSMSTEERFVRLDQNLDQICSRFELAVMLILTIQLFTPARNILSVIIYPQVLKFRYMTNEPVRTAIHNLDGTITDASRRYPMLAKVYAPVRSAVVWFGTQGVRTAANRPRNAECVIM
jgi:hypothetical protein